jgi:hypothetical protein
VIGHLKAEGHLGRCYLKGRAGDAANAILRIQLPPHPRMAEGAFAPIPDPVRAPLDQSTKVHSSFLTVDYKIQTMNVVKA